VIQGDADTDLAGYPTGAFDYVILSQTLPATRSPDSVLRELTRIGRRAVVSFPNVGHWSVRISLSLSGRMPMTSCLPTPWYKTQNIHLCTIRDFIGLCETLGIAILRGTILSSTGRGLRCDPRGTFANLLGGQAVFLLGKP
ncbi:MAG: methionine biosynthesis protein MetW, partial [Alphaproteobacteria bacterium]